MMARTPKQEPAKAAPSVSYVSATVRPDEIYNPMKIAGRADLLVLRAVGEVAICSHAIATACAGQPMRLYRKSKGINPKSKRYRAVDKKRAAYLRGEKERKPGPMVLAATTGQDEFVEVLEHPILEFVKRPNPSLPGYEWTYQRHRHQLEAGNSYTFLFADGVGVEAYPLLPQFVTVQSSMGALIEKYRYSRNRYTFQDLDPSLVMHQRFIPSSWSPMLGASPMEGIIPELDLYAAAVQAETARWSNGGSPPMMFEFPEGTSPEAIQENQQRIQAQIRGVRKSGGNLFLGGGVKASVPGVPAKEMEYIAGMERITKMVWRAFGVPESLMQLNESNLASAVSGNPQFARQTIAPRINADADCLTNDILPLFGLDDGQYFFAADDPCIDDMGANATTAKTLLDARAISVNEARTVYLDLPARSEPEADKLPALPPPPTFGGFGGDPGKPKPDAGNPTPPEPKKWDAKSFRASGKFPTLTGWHFQHADHKAAEDPAKPTDTPGPYNLPPAAQKAADALDAALTAWHEKAARLMADNPAAHRAALESELETILNSHLTEIMRSGAEQAAVEVGDAAATIAERAAADFTRSYVIKLKDSITKQFEADINDAIREAVAEGATQSEAHAEVADIIGEQASYRAERIARTESSRAYSAGTVNAYGEAGWKKQNILAGGACPLCDAIALKYPDPVDADVVFYAVGEIIAGVQNKYVDCAAPPYHPNCRCDVAGVPPEPGEEPAP